MKSKNIRILVGMGVGVIALVLVGLALLEAGISLQDLDFNDNETASWAKWVTSYFITPIPPTEDNIWVLP